jgi:Ni/Fe-hydrogenase subunit HybB-like protein
MERNSNDTGSARKALLVVREFARFLASEMKPKGKIVTPFNVITGTIIVVGIALIAIRFYTGLGAVTNLSQDYPWGILKGFNLFAGVAFAGGAYVLTFVVYIMKLEKYDPIVRVTVLNGFLAYMFYAGALLLELGRPWKIVNPIIGNSFGFSSVLFLIAWHFLLYIICEFIEFSPAVAEWLNWEKARKVVTKMTMIVVIFGITLSTLHQSGLGALFLLAPAKVHPLWYSHYIPVLFFVSSIFAGLSMVIIESTFTHKIFHDKIGNTLRASHDDILLGLAKGCIGALIAYLFLKVIELIHGGHWDLLATPMGYWYLVEVAGFVVLPIFLFGVAIRGRNVRLVQFTAFFTALGVILNRLNVSLIAFKWYSPVRYYPTWIEIWMSLAVIGMQLWVFRWVVNRMPVFTEPPQPAKEEMIPVAEVVRWEVSAS